MNVSALYLFSIYEKICDRVSTSFHILRYPLYPSRRALSRPSSERCRAKMLEFQSKRVELQSARAMRNIEEEEEILDLEKRLIILERELESLKYKTNALGIDKD